MGRKRNNKQNLQVALNEVEDLKAAEMRELMNLNFKIRVKFRNKKQKLMSEAIKNNRVTFVSGPPGTGKAQPLYSKILTPSGWVNMGELFIGDYVISETGDPVKITGIFPQGKKSIYEVKMDDGSKTQCCDEHLWFTQTVNDRKWNKVENGIRDRYSSPKKGTVKSLKDIMKTLKQGDRLNHYIPVVDPVKFPNKKIIIDPYIMGLLIGDGSLTRQIGLTSGDESIYNEFSDYVNENFENLKTRNVTDGNCETIYISKKNKYSQKEENEILNIVRDLKLDMKSDYKFIPKDYLFNSIENRIKILRGLMDSDGHITKSSIYYTTVSEKLKDDFCFLVNSLGGTYSVKNYYPTYTYNGEKIDGKMSYSICFKLKDINPFKLKRKHDRYDELQKNRKYYPIRRIEEVNYIGEVESQCIMVDSDSHLYITDDFIVTHNTMIALKTGLELIKDLDIPIENVVLTTAIVSVGREIGHLPGDLDMKISNYFSHFYSNIDKLVGKKVTSFLSGSGLVSQKIVNFMRGDTFGKYDEDWNPIGEYCILDEGQNMSPMEIKTFISRLGENSKIVVLFDPDQSDINWKGGINGSVDAVNRLKGLDGVGYIEFTDDEIVRDPFLIEIMKAYRDD